jgi:hypothetical protein
MDFFLSVLTIYQYFILWNKYIEHAISFAGKGWKRGGDDVYNEVREDNPLVKANNFLNWNWNKKQLDKCF